MSPRDPKPCRDLPLRAEIRSGKLMIEIGIDTLAFATTESPKLQRYDDGDYLTPKVTDADEWAREVVRALNDEEEDGSTPLTRFLDDVFQRAVDDGAQGIVMPAEEPGR